MALPCVPGVLRRTEADQSPPSPLPIMLYLLYSYCTSRSWTGCLQETREEEEEKEMSGPPSCLRSKLVLAECCAVANWR